MADQNLEQLRARAAELGIEGAERLNASTLRNRIADAESSGSSSGDDGAPQPLSDAERREADAARLREGDGVEVRAIGAGNVVRNRRAVPDEDVERAATRGIYRDPEGSRRVVGAGQPVPAGWSRVESASLEDRKPDEG